jgi:hypothetical protein
MWLGFSVRVDLILKYRTLQEHADIDPLRTKRNPFYLKIQFVPRSKHLPSRL